MEIKLVVVMVMLRVQLLYAVGLLHNSFEVL